MIRLRTLGTLDLTASDGARCQAALAQPRRLGVLLYLALAAPHGLHRRDTILGIFWPEYDQQQARHALRQAILSLRRWLAQDIFLGTGNQDIGVNTSVLWCDAAAFEESFSTGRYAEALSVYDGELLPGFFLKEAPEFDRWLEGERARLRREAATAAWSLAEECITTHDLPGAEHWAHLAAARQPDDESAIRRLIELLDSTGNRAGALRVYEQFAKRVSGEYGLEPSPETRAALASVRARSTVGENVVPSTGTGHVSPAAPAPEAVPSADRPVGQSATELDLGRSSDSPTAARRGPTDEPGPRNADRWRFPGPLPEIRKLTRVAAVIVGLFGAAGILAMASRLPSWRHREGVAAPGGGGAAVGVAVLPFDTQGDTANAYFADGIADEIRSKLSALSGLRVIASTSANQYHRTQKPAEQIGQELGVHYLLIGHIQWEQSASGTRRVRVSPELIEVGAGPAPVTKWQQSYDKAYGTEIFAMQSDIAERVANALSITLVASEEKAVRAVPTKNLPAYDYFLRGQWYSNRDVGGQDWEAQRLALEGYQQAVKLDPTFALAYAWIAFTDFWMWFGGYDQSLSTGVSEQERLELARQAAERALALDPGVPAAHVVLAQYYLLGEADTGRALVELGLSLRGNTNNAQTLADRGQSLIAMSYGCNTNVDSTRLRTDCERQEEGIRDLERAVALDPRNARVLLAIGDRLISIRQNQSGEAYLDRAIAVAPDLPAPYVWKACINLRQGQPEKARAAMREGVREVGMSKLLHNAAKNSYCIDLFRIFRDEYGPAAKQLSWDTFGSDSIDYYSAKALTYHGNRIPERAYWDSVAGWAPSHVRPGVDLVPELHIDWAKGLAGSGRRDAAVTEINRLLSDKRYVWDSNEREEAAEACVMAAMYDCAVEQIRLAMAWPAAVTAPLLKIDPIWDPLRGREDFQRLLREN